MSQPYATVALTISSVQGEPGVISVTGDEVSLLPENYLIEYDIQIDTNAVGVRSVRYDSAGGSSSSQLEHACNVT